MEFLQLRKRYLLAVVLMIFCVTLGSASVLAQTGSIVINEILPDPAAVGDTAGEWFELYNPTTEAVDIDGWTIADAESDTHLINNGGPLVIPAGGYLVLGRNSDPAINGGVTVDYQYSSYTLGNADDEVILLDGNMTEVDRVEYDGGPEFPNPTGASMSLIDPGLDNNAGTNWCESTTPFGDSDLGTPGAANSCEELVEYDLTIAVSPDGSGATEPTAGSHTYAGGTVVNITATAAAGYEFDHWEGDVADSSAAVTTVTIDADKTVTANFITQSGTPPLPSSFFGEIHISDNPPDVGDTVEAYVPDVVNAVASASIKDDAGNLVYTVDVPGNYGIGSKNGGIEGDAVTFKIAGRIVATGVWQGGDNFHLDIHPPEALPGGPYAGPAGSPIDFHGSANDWRSDAAVYEWDWDNDGAYDESGQDPSHTWAAYGEHIVNLKVTDAQGGEGTAVTTVVISNAAPLLETIGDKSVDELLPLTFTATAIDQEPLTFTLEGAVPTGAGITANGDFSWTPTEAQGPGNYTFTVKVCDDGTPSLCDEEEITVTVNEVNTAPVLDAIGDKTITEGTELAFTATATDVDLPANTLTFNLDGAPVGAIMTADGDFSWTPVDVQGQTDYTFDVCVSDGSLSNCETITVTVNDAIVTFSIALAPDWNLISFNVHPEDTDIGTVLSSIAGSYDLVYAWDATGAHSTSGNWMKYDPTAPGYQNTLFELDETMGFWIHMTAADTLEVAGSAPQTTDINLSVTAGGWNLVAYPSAVNRDLPEAFSDHGVGDDFSVVYAYHADDTADPWKLYDVASPEFANDLLELASGWGYWIKVDADSTWSVQYLAD